MGGWLGGGGEVGWKEGGVAWRGRGGRMEGGRVEGGDRGIKGRVVQSGE